MGPHAQWLYQPSPDRVNASAVLSLAPPRTCGTLVDHKAAGREHHKCSCPEDCLGVPQGPGALSALNAPLPPPPGPLCFSQRTGGDSLKRRPTPVDLRSKVPPHTVTASLFPKKLCMPRDCGDTVAIPAFRSCTVAHLLPERSAANHTFHRSCLRPKMCRKYFRRLLWGHQETAGPSPFTP
jgi:hypothetical protein